MFLYHFQELEHFLLHGEPHIHFEDTLENVRFVVIERHVAILVEQDVLADGDSGVDQGAGEELSAESVDLGVAVPVGELDLCAA